MIGRAAMTAPWIFSQTKTYLATGEVPPAPGLEERWAMILRHCRLAVARRRHGGERAAMSSMRARLMAYTRGMEGGRNLRGQLSHVASLAEMEDIAARHSRNARYQNSGVHIHLDAGAFMKDFYVAFDTELFRNEQPDNEIGQWFLGEDLAKWLYHELGTRDLVVGERTPLEEDWGWTLGVRILDTRFWINIWNVKTWIVGLEARPGPLGIFRKARIATSVSALRDALDQLLVTANFGNVSWYDHWPDERCG